MSSSSTASDPGFHPEASDRIEPYVWKIAGVVILGMIMSILDTTIVNVALRTLGHDLHSSLAQIQWVITGYLLSLAAVIPITGWAARRFGAKRVYLTSLVLFTVGSALCAVATSTTELVLFRVLQGAGGGMIMPIAQLIMAQVAGPKRMGRVMGIVAMPAMLGPILGPVVGGTILQSLHWSWIFLVNVPIGFVAFILGWRMLPQTESGEAGRLDVLGLALLSTASTAVVYGLAQLGTPNTSLTAPIVVLPIIAALLLTGVFCWHALRVERPLLDIRLYKNRIFAAASFTTFALGAALFGAMILVPLYYQEVRHESLIATGLLVGPQGLGMLVAMPVAGRLTDRFGGGRVALGGVSVLCLSTIPLAFIGASSLDRRHICGAARAGRGHRLLVHARDDHRVRLAAARSALRRDAAVECPAADRRGDRDGGAGGGTAACERPRAFGHAPGARVQHRLLVVVRDRRARADPLRRAVARREPARPARAATRPTPRRQSSRSAPERPPRTRTGQAR